MDFQELFGTVKAVLPTGIPIYLIGGAVRDVVLGRPVHDLDFGLATDTKKVAHTVARKLNSPYFMLDEQRLAARVIFRPAKSGEEFLLDFVTLVGGDLDTDLKARDFTVNAMAIDVNRPDEIIDPCSGATDLHSSILRACSPTSMVDDPLRIMRGVRISVDLGLAVLPETEASMRAAAPSLKRISPERIRDELFRILEGKDPATAIEKLDSLGAMEIVMPEAAALREVKQSAPHVHDVWRHTLRVLEVLKQLLDAIAGRNPYEGVYDAFIVEAAKTLNQFNSQIQEHLSNCLVSGRSVHTLLLMAALYHDSAKPLTVTVDPDGKIHNYGHDQKGVEIVEERARALALSNIEVEYLGKIVGHHMRIHSAANAQKIIPGRSIYRFFSKTGSAGIDVCLLSLADTLATYEATLPEALWQCEVENCRVLLDAWWNKPAESVRPPKLLTGNDLQIEFGLKPGEKIGTLLYRLNEAQANGEVKTRDEAVDFVRKQINTIGNSDGSEEDR